MTAAPRAGAELPAEEPRRGITAAARRYVENIRAGEVGSMPVLVGIAIIVVFFTLKNGNFFTAQNFNNVIVQMAATTTLAMGVTFVLLLGEIDLSVGFLSGVAGVVVAELQLPGSGHQLPGLVVIALAILVGAAIGGVQGSIVAWIGVPSFVVTLAGNLAFQGVILHGLGTQGVINIQNNLVNNVANYFLPKSAGWIAAGIVTAGYVAGTVGGIVSRRRAGVGIGSVPLAVLRLAFVATLAFGAAAICNRDRGVPFAGLLLVALVMFLTYALTRTTYGRHVYAVGGNAEAARRAGINVRFIRVSVFVISGAMAGLGGVVLAARLSSVDLNAGGGTLLFDAISAAVIGGVSLFGGRGRVTGALLGGLLIATVSNGIDLIGYSQGTKYIATALILLSAVTLDTVSRRRLARAGR